MKRRRWHVQGVVQGVGFRPFVHALATRLGLTGQVGNDAAGVFIEAQGPAEALHAFFKEMLRQPPPHARIVRVQVQRLAPRTESTFVILPSSVGPCRVAFPAPDLATCSECLTELNTPANRRFLYPLISCNHCGPRFSLQRDVPYDRAATSMAAFQPCQACLGEYEDPANRRFHNQAICCPACGPQVWLEQSGLPPIHGAAAIAAARQALVSGAIIAVKGLGGFHLACSALKPEVVQRLRDRKGRGHKPFAIMGRSLTDLQQWVHISPDEAKMLESYVRPILLLATKSGELDWLRAVAPGLSRLGCLLPYTALHHLLVGEEPLVMTSGNLSDEPLATSNEQARAHLAQVADAFLLHDREIVVPCDDSVRQVAAGAIHTLRRARGLTPAPIPLARATPTTLAVGGELKAAFCATRNDEAFLSQHLGDWGAVETPAHFQSMVEHFLHLLELEPQQVVADAHPAYSSAQWARSWADRHGVPCLRVQHHQAHVAALLTERRCSLMTPILGVCLDGTGYGTDGAIWGGEFLVVSEAGWQRFAHLKYVPLPGGDAAIRRPRRVALAHLWAANLPWTAALPCVASSSLDEQRGLVNMLERRFGTIPSSSMGRLFDAVAALLGVRQEVTYEAQAALELEALADVASVGSDVAFAILDATPLQLDPAPVLRSLAAGVLAGEGTRVAAGRFHRAVADAIVTIAERARAQAGVNTVALTGGVFQNALLAKLAVHQLRAARFAVLQHDQVPANDGGLALGQAALATGLIPIGWVSA